MGATGDEIAQHPCQARAMEQRHHVQIAVVDGRRQLGHALHAGRPQVQVRLHDALGKAGGTAGVHHAGQVMAPTAGIFDRRSCGDQLLPRQHAGRRFPFASIDNLGCTLGAGADAFDHRQEVIIDKQDAGVAVIQRIDNLRYRPTGVDRVEHAPTPPGGLHVFQIPVGVQRQHADPVSVGHAQVAQRAGEPRHAVSELTKGAPALAENRDDLLRRLLQRTLQPLGQVHSQNSWILFLLENGGVTCQQALIRAAYPAPVCTNVQWLLPSNPSPATPRHPARPARALAEAWPWAFRESAAPAPVD
ncbi:hypothetical protein D3C80_551080 [compost metagenome]